MENLLATSALTATTDAINDVFKVILFVIGALASYQVLFIFIGFLGRSRKFKETDKKYKYAILISARNEENVLSQLLDSIKKQDYPQELLTVFVIADDCQDKTAEIARSYGYVVYERNNPPKNKRRKSWALKFALENIARDYEGGIQSFDGYFVFDADNLLATNYITEMNKAFDVKKYDYMTSYLGEKNLETTLVSTFSSIGLGGLYSGNMVGSRTSSILGTAPNIRGKGFVVRSAVLKDGWKWMGMTEDCELRVDLQRRGKRGCFVEAAELYDENPHTMKILVRQRLRWERGGFVTFLKYGFKVFVGIFWPREWKRRTKEEKALDYKPKRVGEKIADFFQRRFNCYNQFFNLLPRPIIVLIMGFIYPFTVGIISLAYGNIQGLYDSLWVTFTFYGGIYLVEILTYSAVIIREHKKIRGNPGRMFGYMFIWPFFTMMIQYISIAAIMMPVKWKRIPHDENFEIEQIAGAETIKLPLKKLYSGEKIALVAPAENIYLHESKQTGIMLNMDLFDKTLKYSVADEIRDSGVYPYGYKLTSRPDVVVSMEGHDVIMLGSNNYLGLTCNEEVIQAGLDAVEKYGTGCSGSRFLNGTLDLHTKLERGLADFLEKEDCMTFGTGFQANLGIIAGIAGRNDVIFSDRENHASIYDGCKLSYAQTVRFNHSDMAHLEELLKDTPDTKGKLIVTDGVFSMSGDICKLPEIVALAKKYGARVMVDDAHAFGVLGKYGRGTADHFGLTKDVDIIMGTFSKSLASMGGYCVASARVIDFLRHNSRPYMFCASLTPACVASTDKALEIIKRDDKRQKNVVELAKYLRDGFESRGIKCREGSIVPIVPIYTYTKERTLIACKMLFERGVYVNPVLPPATNEGECLIRISLMATHTKELLDKAMDTIAEVLQETENKQAVGEN